MNKHKFNYYISIISWPVWQVRLINKAISTVEFRCLHFFVFSSRGRTVRPRDCRKHLFDLVFLRRDFPLWRYDWLFFSLSKQNDCVKKRDFQDIMIRKEASCVPICSYNFDRSAYHAIMSDAHIWIYETNMRSNINEDQSLTCSTLQNMAKT